MRSGITVFLTVFVLVSMVGCGESKEDIIQARADAVKAQALAESNLQMTVASLAEVEQTSKTLLDEKKQLTTKLDMATKDAKAKQATINQLTEDLKTERDEREAEKAQAATNLEKVAAQTRKLAEARLAFALKERKPRELKECISADYMPDDLKNKARWHVLECAVQADYVQAYIDIAENYPTTREAELASRRLCEIAYHVVLNEQTFDSCLAFLREFKAAPSEFRNGVLELAVKIRLDDIEKKLDEGLRTELRLLDQFSEEEIALLVTRPSFREPMISKVSTELYIEAVKARKAKDMPLFLVNNELLDNSDLFKGSNGHGLLTIDAEFKDEIRRVLKELEAIQKDSKNASDMIAVAFADVVERLERLHALEQEAKERQLSDQELQARIREQQLHHVASLHGVRRMMLEQTRMIQEGQQPDAWEVYVERPANLASLFVPAKGLVTGLKSAAYLLK